MKLRIKFLFIKDVEKSSEKTYCHPYGGFHTFDKNTINLLIEEDVMYSFNV